MPPQKEQPSSLVSSFFIQHTEQITINIFTKFSKLMETFRGANSSRPPQFLKRPLQFSGTQWVLATRSTQHADWNLLHMRQISPTKKKKKPVCVHNLVSTSQVCGRELFAPLEKFMSTWEHQSLKSEGVIFSVLQQKLFYNTERLLWIKNIEWKCTLNFKIWWLQ